MKKKVYYKLNRYQVTKVEVETAEQEQAVKMLNRDTDRFAKSEDTYRERYLQNNHSNSDMSLMNLLAYWCNGDKEQMLRIFATSGLFRPNKSPDYYEGTAIKALRSMPVKSTYTPTVPKNTGGNGKR